MRSPSRPNRRSRWRGRCALRHRVLTPVTTRAAVHRDRHAAPVRRPRRRASELRAQPRRSCAARSSCTPDPDVREERAMLRSVLDLGEVEVCEIMTHRSKVDMVDRCRPAAGRDRAQGAGQPLYAHAGLARRARQHRRRGARQGAAAAALQGDRRRHRQARHQVVHQPPWFIPESTTLLDQLQAFQRRQEHFALVVDEYGVVPRHRHARGHPRGDRRRDRRRARRPGRGRDRRSPTAATSSTARSRSATSTGEFDWHLPDEEASTIAGPGAARGASHSRGRPGFAFHGFRFEIVRRRKNRILAIRMSPLESVEFAPDQIAK